MSVLRRQLYTEPLVEQQQLPVVLVHQLVAVVHENLDLWCETAHGTPGDPPDSGEAGTRVHLLSPVVHQVDAAASRVVEDDRMDIDLPSVGIDGNEALGRSAGDDLVPGRIE